jgi:lipoprotein-anchoring transpeptidase ErfK/SrfK
MNAPLVIPVLLSLFALAVPARALTADEVNKAGFGRDVRKASAKLDPTIVKAQVLLSRKGISPGVIDGRDGENYRKAISQFRRQERLGDGDGLDAPTWNALGGDQTGDILTDYRITAKDTGYRYTKRIPRDYARQARLARLSYKNAPEMFAEHFHMSEGLLKQLNPRATYQKGGTWLTVVQTARSADRGIAQRIEAIKRTGMLVVYGTEDKILASYPATIGSGDTPSPTGDFEIDRIAMNPTYHYDPAKNFQQGKNRERLVLAKGPNNPVGTVWIGLSKPTFGIHGTPEPSQVSKTSSHGCVRLTNWDAEELADMVKPGVVVRFID